MGGREDMKDLVCTLVLAQVDMEDASVQLVELALEASLDKLAGEDKQVEVMDTLKAVLVVMSILVDHYKASVHWNSSFVHRESQLHCQTLHIPCIVSMC